MSTTMLIGGRTVAVARSTTASRVARRLSYSARLPSGVTVTPVGYGAIGTVATAAFVAVSMIVICPLDAAITREPSGVMARSVGGVPTGTVAITDDAGRPCALG